MFFFYSFYKWITPVKVFCLPVCLGISFPILTAQSISIPPQTIQNLENHFENLEEQFPLDNITLWEELYAHIRQPININHGDIDNLVTLGLMTDAQVQQLQQYIYKIGPLISIYELQAVPLFDKNTIKRIQPFITVDKSLDDLHLSLKEQIREGETTVYIRWQRFLETKRGFQSNDQSPSPYIGDANKVYVRYLHAYASNMSFGLTAEKDAGEPFLKTSNKQGFDFYSFHFFLKNINAKLSRLVIGDFAAQFGQGLILNTNYTRGKGAIVTDIKRSSPSLHRFTAVNEVGALRGVGLTWNLSPKSKLTGFTSFRKRDATIREEEADGGITQHFSALQLSGNRRTNNEIARKNQINQWTTGIQLKNNFHSGSININALHNQYNLPFQPRDVPYNQYRFRGEQLFNVSLDYSYTFRNYHFFGETAIAQNGSIATVNGVVSSLLPTVDLVLHWRHLPRNFQALLGQSFAETGTNNNEQGIYLGWNYQPNRRWTWSAYVDFWKHPWLRFLVDEPSNGREYFTRVAYEKRKHWYTYFQYKQEYKQRSYRLLDSGEKPLLTRRKINFRWHLNYHIHPSFEWRSRVEWSFFKILPTISDDRLVAYDQDFLPVSSLKRSGFLMYQDLLYRPIGKPLSFTTRLAFFNIDNFDTAIYAYENDLLNQFSIPAYYNKGHRIYFNVRYRATQWLTVESRIAQTYWWNQETIGSGQERIDAPHRTEVKMQVRCRF